MFLFTFGMTCLNIIIGGIVCYLMYLSLSEYNTYIEKQAAESMY